MLSLLMHVANTIYADDWQYPSGRLNLTIHRQVSVLPTGATLLLSSKGRKLLVGH